MLAQEEVMSERLQPPPLITFDEVEKQQKHAEDRLRSYDESKREAESRLRSETERFRLQQEKKTMILREELSELKKRNEETQRAVYLGMKENDELRSQIIQQEETYRAQQELYDARIRELEEKIRRREEEIESEKEMQEIEYNTKLQEIRQKYEKEILEKDAMIEQLEVEVKESTEEATRWSTVLQENKATLEAIKSEMLIQQEQFALEKEKLETNINQQNDHYKSVLERAEVELKEQEERYRVLEEILEQTRQEKEIDLRKIEKERKDERSKFETQCIEFEEKIVRLEEELLREQIGRKKSEEIQADLEDEKAVYIVRENDLLAMEHDMAEEIEYLVKSLREREVNEKNLDEVNRTQNEQFEKNIREAHEEWRQEREDLQKKIAIQNSELQLLSEELSRAKNKTEEHKEELEDDAQEWKQRVAALEEELIRERMQRLDAEKNLEEMIGQRQQIVEKKEDDFTKVTNDPIASVPVVHPLVPVPQESQNVEIHSNSSVFAEQEEEEKLQCGQEVESLAAESSIRVEDQPHSGEATLEKLTTHELQVHAEEREIQSMEKPESVTVHEEDRTIEMYTTQDLRVHVEEEEELAAAVLRPETTSDVGSSGGSESVENREGAGKGRVEAVSEPSEPERRRADAEKEKGEVVGESSAEEEVQEDDVVKEVAEKEKKSADELEEREEETMRPKELGIQNDARKQEIADTEEEERQEIRNTTKGDDSVIARSTADARRDFHRQESEKEPEAIHETGSEEEDDFRTLVGMWDLVDTTAEESSALFQDTSSLLRDEDFTSKAEEGVHRLVPERSQATTTTTILTTNETPTSSRQDEPNKENAFSKQQSEKKKDQKYEKEKARRIQVERALQSLTQKTVEDVMTLKQYISGLSERLDGDKKLIALLRQQKCMIEAKCGRLEVERDDQRKQIEKLEAKLAHAKDRLLETQKEVVSILQWVESVGKTEGSFEV